MSFLFSLWGVAVLVLSVFLYATSINSQILASPSEARFAVIFAAVAALVNNTIAGIKIAITPSIGIYATLFNILAFLCISPVVIAASIFAILRRTSEYTCLEGWVEKYDDLYFSFTTITTLGYGDIKPIGVCKVVSSIEAMLGYLLLGVVAAILFSRIQDFSIKQQYLFIKEIEKRSMERINTALDEIEKNRDEKDV